MILSPSIRLSAIGLRSSRVSRLSVERPAQWDEGLSVGLRSGSQGLRMSCRADLQTDEGSIASSADFSRPRGSLLKFRQRQQAADRPGDCRQGCIMEGPICALTAVECRSYGIKVNPNSQRPELAIAPRDRATHMSELRHSTAV